MECIIRGATNTDAAGISNVVIAALRASNSQDYPAEVIARIERNFGPDAVGTLIEKRRVFVAAQAGRIIGTASLDGEVVRSVFVDPEYQGSGVGRQLMAVVHATAADSGVAVLRVPSSITAEAFYAALGYRKVRDEFHGVERTIVMEKRLDC